MLLHSLEKLERQHFHANGWWAHAQLIQSLCLMENLGQVGYRFVPTFNYSLSVLFTMTLDSETMLFLPWLDDETSRCSLRNASIWKRANALAFASTHANYQLRFAHVYTSRMLDLYLSNTPPQSLNELHFPFSDFLQRSHGRWFVHGAKFWRL